MTFGTSLVATWLPPAEFSCNLIARNLIPLCWWNKASLNSDINIHFVTENNKYSRTKMWPPEFCNNTAEIYFSAFQGTAFMQITSRSPWQHGLYSVSLHPPALATTHSTSITACGSETHFILFGNKYLSELWLLKSLNRRLQILLDLSHWTFWSSCTAQDVILDSNVSSLIKSCY